MLMSSLIYSPVVGRICSFSLDEHVAIKYVDLEIVSVLCLTEWLYMS